MSYKVLALKWRPKLFKDAVGQDAIVQTLKNTIVNKKIGHAYLFTGTRGIGKTTFARIFAKAIICPNKTAEGEPCLTCDSCQGIDTGQSLNFIEIDGASNNSVDDIRDLIENVQYLPTSGDYKVYIIDEVHMLSVNAFNALLKTLEEPPKHVVFIFATTDPHKLLGTVISRCLRFDFKNASHKDLVGHLKNIAKEESLVFENENVVNELATQANGSFRDALSLFDQLISLSSSNQIKEESLILSLGIADSSSVNKIISGIFLKDKKIIQNSFDSIIARNIDFKKFSLQVLDKLWLLINSVDGNSVEDHGIEGLDQVSHIEMVWIYENLFKDLEWSLKSFQPLQATLFTFYKVIIREQILNIENKPLEVKKKTVIDEVKEAQPIKTEERIIPAPVQVESNQEHTEKIITDTPNEVKSWDGFIEHLFKVHGSVAMNLEHGNLIEQANFAKTGRIYSIGFSEDSKIFFDYLMENKDKIIEELKAYLGQEIERHQLKLQMLTENEVDESEFLSTVEVKQKNDIEDEIQKTNDIKNNEFIKNAQSLFNSEINKIVLNKEVD